MSVATAAWPGPAVRRWWILALVFAAIVLNYVDRQIVSVLKPAIKSAHGLDDAGYAWLVNVFVGCYACAYAPAGWLADRFGAGRVMLGGMVAWSMACLGAAWSRGFTHLACMRGALGLAEPTTFTAQLRVVAVWFPPGLRGTANSICASGGTIGAIIATPAIAWLAVNHGLNAAFLVPGLAGLVLAVLWKTVYRDPPPGWPDGGGTCGGGLGAAEGRIAFTWPALWRTRSLWGILLVRFVSDPVWYFCLFWLPGYLQEDSGLTLAEVGKYGWIPFLAADLGGVGSSVLSDRLVRRGWSPLAARKVLLCGSALLAPVCVLTPHFDLPWVTLLVFSVVGAVCLTWLFGLGVVVADAFPAGNVGSVWGIAGAFGACGAMVFNVHVGRLMDSIGSERVFTVLALLHPLAALVLLAAVRRETPSDPGVPRRSIRRNPPPSSLENTPSPS